MKNWNFGKKITAVLLALCVGVSMALPAFAAKGDYIGADKAEEKALSYVGATYEDVKMSKTDFDTDDGISYYEVEFVYKTTKYEIDIHATDGTVLALSKKMRYQRQNSAGSGVIGLEKAKEKALAYAGVSSADATFTKAKLERDDGIRLYEIDFTNDVKKYDLELRANDGTVLEYSWKLIKVKQDDVSYTEIITAEKAKEIALKHAGVSAGKATFTKVKLDRDDGVLQYEIEFVSGRMEYEYEINAKTGAVMDYEAEYDD